MIKPDWSFESQLEKCGHRRVTEKYAKSIGYIGGMEILLGNRFNWLERGLWYLTCVLVIKNIDNETNKRP